MQSVAALLGILGLLCISAAQPVTPEVTTPVNVQKRSAAQLDQLTAPIALYPDPLLGSILAAATYPLEVVEAARWLEDPANAALKGDQLTAALEPQSWDRSVKSLVPFPDVLRLMNGNLEWTEQIGDAFLAQQADVMDSVQRLRQRAASTGRLASTPQQTVATQDNEVEIEPASPDVVYVPYYVPAATYAPWPWPDYPPYYFPPFADVVYGSTMIGFGLGIAISEPLWGWYGWDWPGHGFLFGPPHRPNGPPPPWRHDPDHRRGVPYAEPETAARYLGADAAARRPFRGFPSLPEPSAPARATGGFEPTMPPRTGGAVAAPSMPALTRPTAPAFESFGRGSQVRDEAARGFSSRSAPAFSAPASGFHGGGGRPGRG